MPCQVPKTVTLKGVINIFKEKQINGITYRHYQDKYWVSKNGDVYSDYIHRNLKHSIDHDGYHRVDINSRHKKVHQMVYERWGDMPIGNLQINHIDDNKNHNNIENLYCGTQKDNTADRISNKHNTGSSSLIVVKEKSSDKVLIFFPANKFLDYAGHPQLNNGIGRAITRDWFKKNYELIVFGKGVTTIRDECSGGEWSLSPFGARCTVS